MILHRLLARQLKKLGCDLNSCSDWQGFVELVNTSYSQVDDDREMLERSLELSSVELLQANAELRKTNQLLRDEVTERKLAESRLQAALAEKTILLREVHHRVKNNLQIISSLINLQTMRFPDGSLKDAFKLMHNRVRSMAFIHDRLYRSENFSAVDMAEHFRDFIPQIANSFIDVSRHVRYVIDAKSLLLNIDKAVPCGLLINELITNAFKHAFPCRDCGEIRIILRREGADAVIAVEDNGQGLPEDFNVESTDSLGMQLIKALTLQLKGRLTVSSNGGTSFQVNFPV